MRRIDNYRYGTNEIGVPAVTTSGTWVRFDLYTSFADNHQTRERRFAAGRNDDSPLFLDGLTGKYDSRCASCYLNHSHTVAAHNAELAEYQPGTCTRCTIGSKRECKCTFDTGRNYPFSDAMVFCSRHTKHSDVIDVDRCTDCRKPGKQVQP